MPGTPPQGPPHAVPHKKRHPIRNTLLAVIGVLVITGVVSSMNGSGSSTSGGSTGPGSGQAAKPAPKAAGIGIPIRDGKFEFTVVAVKQGVAQLGNQYVSTTAQGQFVLVTVKVENVGTVSQMFDGSNLYLYDTQGRKFEASLAAAIYLGDQAKSFLNDINPGNAVTGVVAFDIPKGAKLARLELHDSVLSGGVDISLS
ncbi:MAG: DUF4352 domain-containing protein [Actinobacteria bacterium]|nr:DUF4352 domain-containing protein [Actinomycetota bacterium]MBI3686431.1 DUF4352 domain-containing protein [Actinomycetota bacterium]